MELELIYFLNEIASKQATEEVFSNPLVIHKSIAEEIALSMGNIPYDYPQLKLNIKHHLRLDNRPGALLSNGCGCVLCIARRRYSRANRMLHLYNSCENQEGFYNVANRYYGDNEHFNPSAYCHSEFNNTEYAIAKQEYEEVNLEYYKLNLHKQGIVLSKKIKRLIANSRS